VEIKKGDIRVSDGNGDEGKGVVKVVASGKGDKR
jgi:hypothetical protein